jgi:hypothetical protein
LSEAATPLNVNKGIQYAVSLILYNNKKYDMEDKNKTKIIYTDFKSRVGYGENTNEIFIVQHQLLKLIIL